MMNNEKKKKKEKKKPKKSFQNKVAACNLSTLADAHKTSVLQIMTISGEPPEKTNTCRVAHALA
jgi:hypothetical protein